MKFSSKRVAQETNVFGLASRESRTQVRSPAGKTHRREKEEISFHSRRTGATVVALDNS